MIRLFEYHDPQAAIMRGLLGFALPVLAGAR